jgi:predicted HAD superfamily hydrolase
MFELQKGVKLYSFDLFDTLVTRKVKKPDLIFEVIQGSEIHYRNFIFRKIGFRKLRIFGERVARRISKNKEEIDIFDIYRVMRFFIRNPAEVLKREISTELEFIVPIENNVVEFNNINKKYKCCITSDMYLPRSVIEKIIKKNVGLCEFFVSSNLDATKHCGSLYEYISNFYNLKLFEIKHFGDNVHADYDVPKKMGAYAQVIDGFNVNEYSGDLFDVFKRENKNIYEKIGYELVGPSALAFAKFIGEDAIKRGVKKVVFTARDCYLIKDIFEKLYPEIKTYYIRVSRRALYVPAFFIDKNYEKFFEGGINAREFFTRLGIESPVELEELNPRNNKELFIRYLKSIDFESYAKDEYETLNLYLRDNGFDNYDEKIGFVDLGWRCSMQSSVSKILGDKFNIHGYYFGTVVKRGNYSSFYFEYTRPIKFYSQIYQALPLFEFLFTEPVLTVKRVRLCNGKYDFDFINDENNYQLEIRKDVCKGAECFFNNYFIFNNLKFNVNKEVSKDYIFGIYKKYLTNPTNYIIDSLSKINHSEGFGGSQQKSLLNGFEKPKLSIYKNSFWRSAYAKKSGRIFMIFHSALYSQIGLFILFKKRSFIERIKRIYN